MEMLKLLFSILLCFIFFDLFFGHGSFHLRLGKKQKPIFTFKIGNSEDEDDEKEKGSF